MKRATLMTFLAVGLLLAGGLLGYWLAMQQPTDGDAGHAHGPAATDTPGDERRVLYWYDPMRPDQHFSQPGKSPFMDMQLVPRYADQQNEQAGLQVSAERVQSLGMRTTRVTRAAWEENWRLPASLAYNQRQVIRLQARADAFVERVYGHAPGDVLAAGTPLADLLVPAWQAAQLEYLALLAHADRALQEAARQRLLLLGMPAADIAELSRSRRAAGLYTLRTPAAGELQQLDLRLGMRVSSGQQLALLNGLDTVWLEAAVTEQAALRVRPGMPLRVHLAAQPGQPLEARVLALLPSLDAQTRTLTLRSELANPEGRLRPGMFAELELRLQDAQPSLRLPGEAVIRSGQRNLVMLAEEDGRFVAQEVRLGRDNGQWVEILEGLQEGQQVVSSGQFLLDSEASLRGLASRPAQAPLHEADGWIRGIEGQRLLLEHGPFVTLNMPGMTMPFRLARAELGEGLVEGMRVRVGVSQGAQGLQVERIDVLEVQP